MKISLISLTFLFVLSCNYNGKKKEFVSPEAVKVQEQTSGSSGYESYLKDVFNDKISNLNLKNDSILFYNSFSAKYSENKQEKHIFMRFKECAVTINSLDLNSDFELLKTHSWLEEAIPHEDLYYKTDEYVVVFDCLKYCENAAASEYFIETLRMYTINDYLEVSKKSHSVRYALKNID